MASKSEIITPPPNEPQPDREAELESGLSKLFELPPADFKPDSKPEEVQKPDNNTNASTEKPESDHGNADSDPVSEPKKTQGDNFEAKPSKEGWKVLRDSHAKAKKTILEKDQELQKIKTSLAERGQTNSQEAENLKKEIEELKSYRALVDYQADPEFIKTYEEPLQEKLSQIKEILTALNVEANYIDTIDYSNTAGLTAVKRLIASTGKDEILADDFFSAAKDVSRLMKKRGEVLDKYRKEYKQVIETKKKESFTKQAENEGRMQTHLQRIAGMKNENGDLRFEFLVDKVAKDPTNAAEVAQIENQNKFYAMLRENIAEGMKAETPEDKTELSVAAAYARFSEAKFNVALKKIESLQAELAKVSKVSSDTPKSQRVRSGTNNGDKNDLDLDSALSSFMSTTR